ncbi:MAG: hypothetical protein HY255_03355 [Betaproteobacteria bacterium]|nr:hypothetical protein [Betaproteobacteria bacterium]
MKPANAIATVLLIAVLCAATPLIAIAQDAKPVAASVREVLTSNIGKRVAVRIESQDIEGTVAAVGTDTVLLTKISGKDFFDSVVVIAKISAVTYKAR